MRPLGPPVRLLREALAACESQIRRQPRTRHIPGPLIKAINQPSVRLYNVHSAVRQPQRNMQQQQQSQLLCTAPRPQAFMVDGETREHRTWSTETCGRRVRMELIADVGACLCRAQWR